VAVYKYQVIAITARTGKDNLANQLNDLGNAGFRVVAVGGTYIILEHEEQPKDAEKRQLP
jgi:hypothetical protein